MRKRGKRARVALEVSVAVRRVSRNHRTGDVRRRGERAWKLGGVDRADGPRDPTETAVGGGEIARGERRRLGRSGRALDVTIAIARGRGRARTVPRRRRDRDQIQSHVKSRRSSGVFVRKNRRRAFDAVISSNALRSPRRRPSPDFDLPRSRAIPFHRFVRCCTVYSRHHVV